LETAQHPPLCVWHVAFYSPGLRKGICGLAEAVRAGLTLRGCSVMVFSKACQMTLSMAGLMMLCVVALARGHGWRASIYLALAVAAKPLAILLFPVLVMLRIGMLWRGAIALSCVVAIPFAFQDASYVMEQYLTIPEMLQNHSSAVQERSVPNAHGTLSTMGLQLSDQALGFFIVAFAVLMMGLSREFKQRLGEREATLYVFTFVAGYILLLCPATERNSYALMAPILGTLYVLALDRQAKRVQAGVLMVTLACLLSHNLHRTFPGSPLSMAKPIACACLLGIAVFWGWRSRVDKTNTVSGSISPATEPGSIVQNEAAQLQERSNLTPYELHDERYGYCVARERNRSNHGSRDVCVVED
jgi:hypothetical protein